ncbi:hypothetical protein [Sphingomonas sp.]|jgi:hypothetical protein|uniref:hypothetical protein n=1 Tax=Sphingomonas sp. TaxID=28214 RepID=UPI002DE6A3B8|nr:hypothetical protein [Sphingomonas sp.]
MPDARLPESVRTYLEETGVRVAVDALLAIRPARLPADLTLAELPDYVAARAQAELTRWEFAQACLDLWSSIWSPLLEEWQAGPLSAMLASGLNAVTPEAIWNESGLNVWHHRGDLFLYTAVELTPEATTIAFGLERDDEPLLTEMPGFNWRNDEDSESWLTHEQIRVPAAFGSELDKLQDLARFAMAQVNAQVGSE